MQKLEMWWKSWRTVWQVAHQKFEWKTWKCGYMGCLMRKRKANMVFWISGVSLCGLSDLFGSKAVSLDICNVWPSVYFPSEVRDSMILTCWNRYGRCWRCWWTTDLKWSSFMIACAASLMAKGWGQQRWIQSWYNSLPIWSRRCFMKPSSLISRRSTIQWIESDVWKSWRHMDVACDLTSFSSSNGFGIMQRSFVESATFLGSLSRLVEVPLKEGLFPFESSTWLLRQYPNWWWKQGNLLFALVSPMFISHFGHPVTFGPTHHLFKTTSCY